MRANRQEEATVELRGVLAQDPGNYLAARTLGDALFDLGENDAAIAAYRRALANGRDAAYYHYRIALLHERRRSYAEAAREFARLVDMDPQAAAEVADHADRLLEAGAAAAAIEYFRAAQRADHGAELAMRLADAQLGSGRAADAVETLERARESHPAEEPLRTQLVRALNALGAARGDAGDLAGAARAFSRAASLAPSDFESLANGGLAQLRAGQMAEALETLTRALALRPAEVRLLNPVAELRFRRGDLSEARDLRRNRLAVDPRQPRMQAALARRGATAGRAFEPLSVPLRPRWYPGTHLINPLYARFMRWIGVPQPARSRRRSCSIDVDQVRRVGQRGPVADRFANDQRTQP